MRHAEPSQRSISAAAYAPPSPPAPNPTTHASAGESALTPDNRLYFMVVELGMMRQVVQVGMGVAVGVGATVGVGVGLAVGPQAATASASAASVSPAVNIRRHMPVIPPFDSIRRRVR